MASKPRPANSGRCAVADGGRWVPVTWERLIPACSNSAPLRNTRLRPPPAKCWSQWLAAPRLLPKGGCAISGFQGCGQPILQFAQVGQYDVNIRGLGHGGSTTQNRVAIYPATRSAAPPPPPLVGHWWGVCRGPAESRGYGAPSCVSSGWDQPEMLSITHILNGRAAAPIW